MIAVADGMTFELVVFGVVIVGVVVAAIAVVTSSDVYSQIGKGGLFEDSAGGGREGGAPAMSGPERETEIRQMLQARNERRIRRGEAPLDVDAELARLEAPSAAMDPALIAEIRDLVIARNERRTRRGEPPLDVEQEVQRQVKELGG